MTEQKHNGGLEWLIEAYFSNPGQRIKLQKGDRLLEQGAYNDRLFLVLGGKLGGFSIDQKGQPQKIFQATRNMFVGVYSLFSKTYSSTTTVIAEEDCEVAYIDQNQELKSGGTGTTLFEQFLPIVMMDLAQRWQREKTVVNEREKALKQLIQTEKMASLGQMAAGLAHELNNAIAVLERNSTWLSQRVADFISREHPENHEFFMSGLQQGRRLSSRDIRKRTKELSEKFSLDQDNARKLAETGISRSELKSLPGALDEMTDEIYTYWEFGASFHDMKIAAQHATHVVKSVKALASQSSAREPDLDVNESIHESLALLSSPLRKVEVKLNLGKLPGITANKGELVQVWANLVKNSVEAMEKAETVDKHLIISSEARGKTILVRVQDNGPGIPADAVERIFQPSFTTKERGLDFGLGLGLTIVERIVLSYDGEISVRSKPGKTVFTVKLK